MESSSAIQNFQEAKPLFLQAQRIVIISHRNPDADAIGANLALREALENLGKTVTSACVDSVPEDSAFLPNAYSFQSTLSTDHELVVSVDCGSHEQLGFHLEHPMLLDRSQTTLVNIDHHPSNDFFGAVNIVLPETPSTCFILYHLFNSYGWEITPSMATALLHGLYYDTGCFMHPNTDAATLRVAARLKALGADQERIVKQQFHNSSISKLRLWGRALSRADLNKKSAVITAITEKDFQEEHGSLDDLSGVINYLNQVPEAKFCVLLAEDQKGNIKGSLRTQRDDVNLSAVAGLFGGGGHTKAAGFTLPGRLKEKRVWKID